ncbi:MAG: DUF1667 domain-containing protein [Lachnospiraceae bacterium]|jgi:CxxC motif-containing protein|nr:DUF1667 domain-containing protein [Lachnospiraceae bacterium]
MEKRELTCIGCPLGCSLTVTLEGGHVRKVEGNTCKKGEEYGKKECTNPTRVVTSTVRVKDGTLPVVSVKTAEDIPKGKIREIMLALRGATAQAPVAEGEVLLENAAGTGVPVVATKSIFKKGTTERA